MAWFSPTSRCPVYGSVISVYLLARHCKCISYLCAGNAPEFSRYVDNDIVRVTVERSQTQLFSKWNVTKIARFRTQFVFESRREQTSCRIISVDVSSWLKPRDEEAWPLLAFNSHPKWSAVDCQSSSLWSAAGRWTLSDKRSRRASATYGVPASPSLVATSRSTKPSSSRTHRRRGRADDRALTPGSSASRYWRTDVNYWRYVLPFPCCCVCAMFNLLLVGVVLSFQLACHPLGTNVITLLIV